MGIKTAEVSKTRYMIEVAKALSYNQNYILHGLSSPAHAVYMFKNMILLNSSSETTWSISTNFAGPSSLVDKRADALSIRFLTTVVRA